MADPTPTPPVKEESTETKKIIEQITTLNETIGGLQTNIETIQADVDALATPATPEPDKPKYQPKSWDDIPKTAEDIAQQVYDRNEKARRDAEAKRQEEETAADKNVQKEINVQVEALEKAGTIPPIKDANNENDPGRMARREIFGLAADLGTTNLDKVAETLSNLNKQNIHYDFKSKKYLRTSGVNPGQGSPIGSSGASAGSSGGGPDYKMIHKAKSLSELKRMAGM